MENCDTQVPLYCHLGAEYIMQGIYLQSSVVYTWSFIPCIWETLTLSMCVDRSPNTKNTKKIWKLKIYMSPVKCHTSRVMYRMSLMPTVTATDPPSANSPTLHNMFVCKPPLQKKILCGNLSPFPNKVAKSDTTLLSSLFYKQHFCNWFWSPKTSEKI